MTASASAVPAAAETATAAASWTTSSTASATAASTAGATSTVTTSVASSIGATISAAFGAALSWGASGYGSVAVEVGLVVGEIGAAFDGQCRSMGGFTTASFSSTVFGRKFAAAHLGALLLENGFARQADAVAFDGQHLHQYLVAFFQFVANVLNAVFRDFADVQQAVGAGDDFDESAEVSQASDCAEIGLPDFGCRGQVADDLQGLGWPKPRRSRPR